MAFSASIFVPPPPAATSPASSLRRPPPSPPSPYHALPLTAGLRRYGHSSRNTDLRLRRRLLTSGGEFSPEEEEEEEGVGFDEAAALFNGGDYHRFHDVVEELWYGAEEPGRTLLHGLLQCAVGFHHLFNQNHRGAMMELGEGLCKLRKLGLDEGPFARFEEEVSVSLEFVYHTQKELAACTEDLCLAMDGSESSYQLLGNFAAGQQLYRLDVDANGVSHIIFTAANHCSSKNPLRVKVPTLNATGQDLRALQYTCEYIQ